MPATQSEHDALEEQFEYHRPTDIQLARIASVREAAKNLGRAMLNCVPPGPDRSAAIRKVREAMMTANAGIVLGPEQF